MRKNESKEDPLRNLRLALQKDITQRNRKDLEGMVVGLKQIKFFKEREIPDKSYLEIAQSLTYLELPQGAIVFEYGTLGDIFYIILKGTVSFHTPNKDKIQNFEKENAINN